MTTTTLFAEILIVGLQASIWMGLIAATALGWNLGDVLDRLAGISGAAMILLLAVAYVAGIIVDRFADSVGAQVRRFGGTKGRRRAPANMRMRVLLSDTPAVRFLEYQRSRIRIMRGTVLNTLLITGVGVVYLAQRSPADGHLLLVLPVVGGVVAAASAFCAYRINRSYLFRLRQAYDWMVSTGTAGAVEGTQRSSDMAHDQDLCRDFRAAAVVYRRTQQGPEFLLVTTKKGDHWTFPKGNIESKRSESALEACVREAEEEAGVLGIADPRPVCAYLFPRKPAAGGDAVCVLAYLVEVQSLVKPTEPGRRREWLSAAAAKEHLAIGRSSRFAAEHARVIDAAVERVRDG